MKTRYLIPIMLILIGFGAWKLYSGGADPLQPQIAKKILRFHILANSDAPEDQEVKLVVRDAVGNMLAPKLARSENLAETEQIIEESMDEIVSTAKDTLAREGYCYGVSAELAHTDFPIKTYGQYTFPAGEYEALEITLGEGQGHNWWCVLYPNMCFQGTVYEVIDENSKEKLRAVLSPQEYADVFESGSCQVRLRIVELLKRQFPGLFD